MTESVCAEFFNKFSNTNSNSSIQHEDKIAFMLSNPTIKLKLDEWVEQGKSEVSQRRETTINDFNKPEEYDRTLPNYQQAASAEASPAYRHEKNTKHSIQKREEGNVHFQKKKLYESLASYNEAIRFATFTPNTSSNRNNPTTTTINTATGGDQDMSLPIAFANRSAVYYDMGKDYLHRSLADADLALTYGYPEHLKTKLLVRKATIFVQTKRYSSAEECLIQAKYLHRKYHKHPKAPVDILTKISKMEREIVKELRPSTSAVCTRTLSCSSLGKSLNQISNEVSNFDNDLAQFKENPKFDGAADSVMLNFSKDGEEGRFVTCSKDLNIGDVVFCERPFASVLIPEFYEKYCHHCNGILKDGFFFPCIGCTQVKFCSESCSENAWNQYHQYECLYLELLQSVGIAHLALRVVLVAGIDEVLNVLHLDKAEKWSDNNVSNLSMFAKGQSKYQRVYSLLEHSRSMYPEDVFQYALTASLLTNYLGKKTSFFDACKQEDRLKIGGVILRHICQLISNAHAITSIVSDFGSDKISLSTVEESQLKIASAIYPSASMMNHSCDPNITFNFCDGNQLVVKVSKKLQRREEIFNCYGPHYRRSPFKQRQEELKDQYFFACKCKVCEKEKEEGFSFADQFHCLKCYKCEGHILPDEANQTFLRECIECNEFQNIREQLQVSMQTDKLFELGNTLLDEGKVEEALKTFVTVYKGRKEVLYKLNAEIGEVCDRIGKCHAILGEFREAVPYVEESNDYIGARFGTDSLEYSREMKKYTDLVEQSRKSKTNKKILGK